MRSPVIPVPVHTKLDAGSVRVGRATSVIAESLELESIATTFVTDVREDTGLELSASSECSTEVRLALRSQEPSFVSRAAGLRADGEEIDERYTIMSTPNQIRVEGATPEAVHRGLTTLRQIIAVNAVGDSADVPVMFIADGPRFAWRGILVDVARTYYPPQALRRVIDMCSLYKINVLHLHLTDDQGWRIEVPARPELTAVGSVSTTDRAGGFYTQGEIADLVDYARARFVTLIPEIDMPGHSAAIFRAYPTLAKAAGPEVEMPAEYREMLNNLDPDDEETWALVADVIDAVIPQFPQSAFIHIGGDEPFGMRHADHTAFVDRVIQLVRSRGRQVIGWQEIARARVDADAVVQYWLHPSEADLEEIRSGGLDSIVPSELLPFILESADQARGDLSLALRKGARVLASPTNYLYFDRPHVGPASDESQEEQRARVGMPAYPPLSLRDGFEWDPVDVLPGIGFDDDLIGVEGAVWSETLEAVSDLEFMLLPRLCGLSEKAWGQRSRTGWNEFQQLMSAQTSTWDHRGWNWYRSNELVLDPQGATT